MKLSDIIYVTGHKHPDSDSIISSIAYAQFKERKGEPAKACRLGKMNAETEYLLNRFGFEKPMLFEDARATLEEVEIDEPLVISPTTTIYETLDIMEETGKRSLGIVNERKQLMGMVTKSDLAAIGLGDTAFAIQLLQKTSMADIAKTISGTLLYDDDKVHFNGKTSIIAIAETRLKNYDLKDRLVIIGNDTDGQLAAIRKGAGVLLIVWADGVEDEVLQQAKEMHCALILSGHGTMNTSRYLFFSPPVNLVMQKDLISFNVNEFIDDAGKKMMKTRFRSYPVVDNDNRLCGYISRFHILNAHNKKVVLVDHNEYAQSVKGIERAELLEVIDHHRVCDISTNRPISFRNEIIGSTAAIITSIYMENQMSITKELAGLLLGAILSDTLKFKSPTTTEKDHGMAKVLADIAGLDMEEFAREMFMVSSNIKGKSMRDLVERDIKSFDIDDKRVMIAQIIVYELAEVREIEKQFQEELERFSNDKSLDLLAVAFTSILENGSIFYAAGEYAHIVEEAFPDVDGELHSFHEDILSRKNQIVPRLSRALLNH